MIDKICKSKTSRDKFNLLRVSQLHCNQYKLILRDVSTYLAIRSASLSEQGRIYRYTFPNTHNEMLIKCNECFSSISWSCFTEDTIYLRVLQSNWIINTESITTLWQYLPLPTRYHSDVCLLFYKKEIDLDQSICASVSKVLCCMTWKLIALLV